MRSIFGVLLGFLLLTGCQREQTPRPFTSASRTNVKVSAFFRKDLPYSNFRQISAAGIPFYNSTLWGSDFAYAQLPKADFRFSDLTSTQFQNANLRGAVLTGAILCDANFDGADLRGAHFDGALLWHTSFKNVICDAATRGIPCP
jgi:uncharacterized protein YjbI with pentapeptide repeats